MKKTLITIIIIFQVFVTYAQKVKKDKSKSKPNSVISQINPLLSKEYSNEILPQQNFFNSVNDTWLKANPIPNTEASWGAFNILEEDSKGTVKKIAEDLLLISNPKGGSNQQLLKDFYKSGLDQVNLSNEQSAKILKPFIDTIINSNNSTELFDRLNILYYNDIKFNFNYYVDQDAKNTTQYTLYISQDGLGLPDRDYYLREDAESKKIIIEYKKYIEKLFTLYGAQSNDIPNLVNSVYEIEKYLAINSMTNVETRDPQKTYNKFALRQLIESYPWANWEKMFGKNDIDSVVIQQPEFLKASLALFQPNAFNPEDSIYITVYHAFHIINSLAKYLSPEYQNARFDFYGKTLYGMPEMDPQWKLVVRNMNDLLRDAVGQEYIKTKFSPEAKTKVTTLVENIRAAYADRIKKLTWMSNETKAKALDKLAKIDLKIGYPDKWIDYSKVDIKDQPYIYNVLALKQFEIQRQVAKLGKPVDRTEWYMGPQTVNAYYNPLMNEIVFPAAILQAPFFDINAADASNYGGIGMVIGHEFTHGFDDEGRQYDADGNLKDWWQPVDAENFKKLTQKFVDEYSKIEPVKGVHINGELTLGENIADFGGLVIAYDAMKKAIPNEVPLNGITPTELFFLNFAKIWREHTRDESLRNQLLTDPHSPAESRVNVPLSNFDKFYEFYGVKQIDKMFKSKKERYSIW